MAREPVYVEYISLHRYIRNTPSDTEEHTSSSLRAARRARGPVFPSVGSALPTRLVLLGLAKELPENLWLRRAL